MSRLKLTILLLFAFSSAAQAMQILIPMDESQKNHLKSYGIAFWLLKQKQEVQWLLNYNGGSFMFQYSQEAERECKVRGVSYETISDAAANAIITQIQDPAANLNAVKLLNAPKIAVYSPKTKQPWDDAVTLVLTYAEIPYDVIFDDEVLSGKILEYDWLHLHHEDFTGQYGKFYSSYASAPWYQAEVAESESMAAKHGFESNRELKLAVVKKIRDFMLGGGFLFAMCSATDSYDIAMAAESTDICESMFDGTPADPEAQSKLNFDNCIAFKDFALNMDPYFYEFSNIDVDPRTRAVSEENDLFTLFDYSAKWDLIPSILCQNHTKTIKGFMGQTTAYRSHLVRSDVLVMGENALLNEARYLHGEFGKGTWTFFGGHDPEDYQHFVGEAPTDLNLHPNSPGYRLILNNILFPSAQKSKQKT
ncbi:MAG: asparagine synthetase B [Bacteroidetes bacterium]|nr:asparagine synthetase B [Bacteroidota bacterium]MDA1224283.1 asparagine synthetase B [Bacteroidota bacterium]